VQPPGPGAALQVLGGPHDGVLIPADAGAAVYLPLLDEVPMLLSEPEPAAPDGPECRRVVYERRLWRDRYGRSEWVYRPRAAPAGG
jgi:hypothetical protein